MIHWYFTESTNLIYWYFTEHVELHFSPSFPPFCAPQAAARSIYRVEYTHENDAFSFTGSARQGSLGKFDAVCSVCQAPARAWSLMVPGRKDCPASFTLDYRGYLMASRWNSHYRSKHVCVDYEAEGVAGSDSDAQSATLFPVETDGELSSEYADNKEISCAQCSTSAGPTYVRWGRTTCPTATTLVYKGRAAGSHHADQGGGHNYVCLHETPTYGEVEAGLETDSARLYRVEYDTGTRGLWKLWRLHERNVPCAVCQTTGSLATLMQPGATACPEGWSTEYTGKRAPCHY